MSDQPRYGGGGTIGRKWTDEEETVSKRSPEEHRRRSKILDVTREGATLGAAAGLGAGLVGGHLGAKQYLMLTGKKLRPWRYGGGAIGAGAGAGYGAAAGTALGSGKERGKDYLNRRDSEDRYGTSA